MEGLASRWAWRSTAKIDHVLWLLPWLMKLFTIYKISSIHGQSQACKKAMHVYASARLCSTPKEKESFDQFMGRVLEYVVGGFTCLSRGLTDSVREVDVLSWWLAEEV